MGFWGLVGFGGVGFIWDLVFFFSLLYLDNFYVLLKAIAVKQK